MIESFADLIAPVTPERFFAEIYGRQPLHIPAGAGDKRQVLTWARFNEALSIAPYWTEPHLKLMVEGRRIASEHYCDLVQTVEGQKLRANADKVRVFLGMGASLVANFAESLTPELRAVARAVEGRLLGLVNANVYSSFKGRRAFHSHYDTHEVFAIHTEGEKVWRVYEGRADNPVAPPPDRPDIQEMHERAKGKLLFEVTMRPGDVLYLPRGWYHDALASSDASLHVTFSAEPRTGRALFRLLEAEALEDSLFRDWLPLPDEDGGRALAARLKTLGERLAALAASPALAEAVARTQRAARLQTQDFALPAVTPLEAYDVAAGDAVVVRAGDGWAVKAGGTERPLAGGPEPARWVLARPAFTVQELKAWFPHQGAGELEGLVKDLRGLGLLFLRS